jgi:tetratricopeptide (TPR) repeat protein
MGKKRKRKKRSIATDIKAIYQRGMQLYLEEENYIAGLKHLFRAAKAGYKKAYGEIGIILYREKNETDKAEDWFKKAETANSLFPVASYEYGMLFYLEKGDIKTSLKYLLQSAKQGCELAYGQIGIILFIISLKWYLIACFAVLSLLYNLLNRNAHNSIPISPKQNTSP